MYRNAFDDKRAHFRLLFLTTDGCCWYLQVTLRKAAASDGRASPVPGRHKYHPESVRRTSLMTRLPSGYSDRRPARPLASPPSSSSSSALFLFFLITLLFFCFCFFCFQFSRPLSSSAFFFFTSFLLFFLCFFLLFFSYFLFFFVFCRLLLMFCSLSSFTISSFSSAVLLLLNSSSSSLSSSSSSSDYCSCSYSSPVTFSSYFYFVPRFVLLFLSSYYLAIFEFVCYRHRYLITISIFSLFFLLFFFFFCYLFFPYLLEFSFVVRFFHLFFFPCVVSPLFNCHLHHFLHLPLAPVLSVVLVLRYLFVEASSCTRS